MEDIKQTILRYLRDETQPGDNEVLHQWLAESPANQALLDELQDTERVSGSMARMNSFKEEEAWARFKTYTGQRKAEEAQQAIPLKSRSVGTSVRWLAAAVVIALLGLGTWLLLSQNKRVITPDVASTSTDVPAPQSTRATLTLANGRIVYLDSAASGTLAAQGQTKIIKSNGQLSYTSSLPVHTAGGEAGTSNGRQLLYNTLFNPRGSQVIAVVLSDGTKVWLNAESSIRYPVLFNDSMRRVEITGEAYFEVAKNTAKPFFVTVGNHEQISVLGTNFNVSAYDEDPAVRTTLLEGAIAVVPAEHPLKPVILKPGEQAILPTTGDKSPSGSMRRITIDRDVETDRVIAWKTGYFDFDQEDIRSILRQVARWYNIKIVYAGEAPAGHFSGIVSRSRDISAVLRMFGQGNIHYEIHGNEITILNR